MRFHFNEKVWVHNERICFHVQLTYANSIYKWKERTQYRFDKTFVNCQKGSFTLNYQVNTGRKGKRLREKTLNDAAGQIVPCNLRGQRVCLMSNCIRTAASKDANVPKNVPSLRL